jgi:hypothetical protein
LGGARLSARISVPVWQIAVLWFAKVLGGAGLQPCLQCREYSGLKP